MKISIDNFKTLKSLEEFEFKPFTLITGINSSGKSSFIQFLLLLKQTLSKPATNAPINLEGDFIKVNTFEEIIFQKNAENKLSLTLTFDNSEYIFTDFGPSLVIDSCDIKVIFTGKGDDIIVDSIEFNYYIPNALNKDHFLKLVADGKEYRMTTSTALFNKDFENLLEEKDFAKGDVLFSSFFPQLFTTQILNPDFKEGEDSKTTSSGNKFDELLDKTKPGPYKQYSVAPSIKKIEEFITNWFSKISYIGPLREEPSEYYPANKSDGEIGKKGQYAAYILEKEAKNRISYLKSEVDLEGLISFSEHEDTLVNAVNHWICDVFKLAKHIYSVEAQDTYQVLVENIYGVETSIKHVGFGISQVLPIIVEGLRMSSDSLLVLEQPEIHLHPKIQGQLFDFFYSLMLKRKKILIETHSDHLIVRMRRRIAEDEVNNLLSMINLEFAETGEISYYFEQIELTELGSIREFPKDFIEQQDDYRAIVRAQARRKLK